MKRSEIQEGLKNNKGGKYMGKWIFIVLNNSNNVLPGLNIGEGLKLVKVIAYKLGRDKCSLKYSRVSTLSWKWAKVLSILDFNQLSI